MKQNIFKRDTNAVCICKILDIEKPVGYEGNKVLSIIVDGDSEVLYSSNVIRIYYKINSDDEYEFSLEVRIEDSTKKSSVAIRKVAAKRIKVSNCNTFVMRTELKLSMDIDLDLLDMPLNTDVIIDVDDNNYILQVLRNNKLMSEEEILNMRLKYDLRKIGIRGRIRNEYGE